MKKAMCVISILLGGLVGTQTFAADYVYDDLNRLKTVTYDAGTVIIYEYDKAGNIVSVTTESRNEPKVAEGKVDETGQEEDPDKEKSKENHKSGNSNRSESSVGQDEKVVSQEGKNEESKGKAVGTTRQDEKVGSNESKEKNAQGHIGQSKQSKKIIFTLNSLSMQVDGKSITMDTKIFASKKNRLMVPIRYMAYALGISEKDILWDGKHQQVIIRGKKEVRLIVGSDYMFVDGQAVKLNERLQVVSGRVFLPIADICRAFGRQYTWDNARKQLIIF